MTMIGESPVFQQVVAQAERLAPSRIPVLLVGETGTGKELLAHHIHHRSGRPGEFIDVNCGAIPPAMAESLLFGHRRGAFTGAVTDSVGLVAHAHAGTLFLDELSSLPMEGQAKLLRVLETRELRRLGDVAKRSVDFRLIAAVQDDFAERVEQGAFRRDLYHRIAGIRLVLPPLRERPEDIALIAHHFAAMCQRRLSAESVAMLRRHAWPGNIRELRAVVERAAALGEDRVLPAAVMAEALDEPWEVGATKTSMRANLLAICTANDWAPPRIAQALGISRATLYRRLSACGIQLRRAAKSHGVSRRS